MQVILPKLLVVKCLNEGKTAEDGFVLCFGAVACKTNNVVSNFVKLVGKCVESLLDFSRLLHKQAVALKDRLEAVAACCVVGCLEAGAAISLVLSSKAKVRLHKGHKSH